jgi:predicted RNA-binding protein Jag
MENNGQEFTGKSVDEAVADGLAQLGLRRDQVEVEILSRGSRGIFGLGSEPARVRITRLAPKTEPKPPAARPPESWQQRPRKHPLSRRQRSPQKHPHPSVSSRRPPPSPRPRWPK